MDLEFRIVQDQQINRNKKFTIISVVNSKLSMTDNDGFLYLYKTSKEWFMSVKPISQEEISKMIRKKKGPEIHQTNENRIAILSSCKILEEIDDTMSKLIVSGMSFFIKMGFDDYLKSNFISSSWQANDSDTIND